MKNTIAKPKAIALTVPIAKKQIPDASVISGGKTMLATNMIVCLTLAHVYAKIMSA